MSIEIFLFTIISLIAVSAAVGMLLSRNAVHSALFLILNFACVAFLYILLDASFLAMVQIAVYAGAIMVLFLFVIMLLGAEKVGEQHNRQFKWLSPLALVLALSLLISLSMAILAGEVDTREVPEAAPMLRVVHVAPDYAAEPVDVYLNGELAVSELDFSESSDFETLPAGDYEVGIALAGTDAVFGIGTVTLEAGQTVSAIAYGEGRLPQLATVDEDMSNIEGRDGRVIYFNAYSPLPAISVLDTGSDGVLQADELEDVLVANLAFGEFSEIFIEDAGEAPRSAVNATNTDQVVAPFRDFTVERGTSELVVVAAVPDGLGDEVIGSGLTFATDVYPQFGSPEAIGQSLFVDYVLPFQMVAVLLLAAMVGAIVLTQRADVKPKPGRPTRRKVSRPLTSVIASQTGHEVYTEEEAPQLEAEIGEPVGD